MRKTWILLWTIWTLESNSNFTTILGLFHTFIIYFWCLKLWIKVPFVYYEMQDWGYSIKSLYWKSEISTNYTINVVFSSKKYFIEAFHQTLKIHVKLQICSRNIKAYANEHKQSVVKLIEKENKKRSQYISFNLYLLQIIDEHLNHSASTIEISYQFCYNTQINESSWQFFTFSPFSYFLTGGFQHLEITGWENRA